MHCGSRSPWRCLVRHLAYHPRADSLLSAYDATATMVDCGLRHKQCTPLGSLSPPSRSADCRHHHPLYVG